MRPSLRQVLFRSAAGLDLNFAGGVFSLNNTRTDSPANIPGWSFSRTDTNGTATALDLAGNVIQFPSRTNLVLRSQEFDNAAWFKTLCTVTANQAIAPDGSLTADLITDTSASGTQLDQVPSGISAGAICTASRFVKYDDVPWVRLVMGDAVNFIRAWFNVQTGTLGSVTVGGTGGNASATITPAANGFYRCTITGSLAGATTYPTLSMTADANASTGRVNGGKRVEWGAQFEVGSTATAYIPTTTAAVTVVLPRITNRGILVEEARTNLLLNSVFAGGAAAPTSWTQPVGTGTSAPATSTITTAATAYQQSGTAERPYLTQQVTVAVGTYTVSVYVESVTGSVTAEQMIAYGGGTATVSGVTHPACPANPSGGNTSLINAGLLLFSITVTGAGTLSPRVGLGVSAGGATGTVRFSLPQTELGAFATSPIITTGAAGTRGAEVPFLALSDSAAYTIVAEGFGSPGTAAAILTSRDDTTSNNRVQIGNAGQVITYGAAAGGVSEFFVTTATTSIPSFKAAVRVAVNDAAVAINGAIVQTDTVFAVPATTRLAVGIDRFSGAPFNSYIQRIRVLPFAATDAQLQALTAP
jgi:hypothetical protein